MVREELEGLDRESLVVRAQGAGIRRARVLTRPELIDELLRLDTSVDEGQLKRNRGFFGRARDLVARVVERGLHLPDAADRIRTVPGGPDVPYALTYTPTRAEPQAMPTVTLAEIYAAQGHPKRAMETLQRVLEREPEHVAATALLARLQDARYVAQSPALPPEPEIEVVASAASVEPEQVEVAEAIVEPDVTADECIAIPLSNDADFRARLYVQWRLRPAIAASRDGARVVLRAYVVTPTWEGPVTETRDVEVDVALGEWTLTGLPTGSVVRVALGVFERDEFVPFAHSLSLEFVEPRGLVIWTWRGVRDALASAPEASSIARALACAQKIQLAGAP